GARFQNLNQRTLDEVDGQFADQWCFYRPPLGLLGKYYVFQPYLCLHHLVWIAVTHEFGVSIDLPQPNEKEAGLSQFIALIASNHQLRIINNDPRGHENKQFALFRDFAAVTKQNANVRNVAEKRHFGDVIEYLLLKDTAQHNRFAAFNQHLGANFLRVDGHRWASRSIHGVTTGVLRDLQI